MVMSVPEFKVTSSLRGEHIYAQSFKVLWPLSACGPREGFLVGWNTNHSTLFVVDVIQESFDILNTALNSLSSDFARAELWSQSGGPPEIVGFCAPCGVSFEKQDLSRHKEANPFWCEILLEKNLPVLRSYCEIEHDASVQIIFFPSLLDTCLVSREPLQLTSLETLNLSPCLSSSSELDDILAQVNAAPLAKKLIYRNLKLLSNPNISEISSGASAKQTMHGFESCQDHSTSSPGLSVLIMHSFFVTVRFLMNVASLILNISVSIDSKIKLSLKTESCFGT